MPETVLRTAQIARECGVHVNTVRFYERVGLISPVPRDARDYRVFSPRHLYQVKVLRLLYSGDWPGRPVRARAAAILEKMKEWDLCGARRAVREYIEILDRELDNAKKAVGLLREWEPADSGTGEERYGMREVARMLSVSREAMRNWERNNLIRIPREGANQKRYVTTDELNRLRVIAVLIKSGHSIAVIHHALSRLRAAGTEQAIEVFSQPDGLEVLSAGDHYLEVLTTHRERADSLGELIEGIPAEI